MRPQMSSGSAVLRGAFALLLALSVANLVNAQEQKRELDSKETAKLPEIKWPTEINGRDLLSYAKDLEHPDPVIREFAARTLPNFGPPAQKGNISKLLLKRMTAERDPGVRFAVYGAVGAIAFDDNNDNKEAVRILAGVIDNSPSGSPSRYQAVKTIAMFGPKGEAAIPALTGQAMDDLAYETRRVIASTLGTVGFDEISGPNMRALTALADRLARDTSAAVRMEALQAILNLGPPWAAVRKKDDKLPPPIKAESAAVIIKYMKLRVGDPKATPKPIPGLEKDKQVEIWARLVLMRFDPKELNDDNFNALALHLTGTDVGVRVQALQAIGMLGEVAGRKVDAVIHILKEKDQPLILTVATIKVLVAMGAGAKPAIPDLKKLAEDTKKEIVKIDAKKEPLKELPPEEAGKKRNAEDLVKLIEAAIKHIETAKSNLAPMPADPKKP